MATPQERLRFDPYMSWRFFSHPEDEFPEPRHVIVEARNSYDPKLGCVEVLVSHPHLRVFVQDPETNEMIQVGGPRPAKAPHEQNPLSLYAKPPKWTKRALLKPLEDRVAYISVADTDDMAKMCFADTNMDYRFPLSWFEKLRDEGYLRERGSPYKHVKNYGAAGDPYLGLRPELPIRK